MPSDGHISTILFCNLIGDVRFQLLEVHSLIPPVVPGSLGSLFSGERAWEWGYETFLGHYNCLPILC